MFRLQLAELQAELSAFKEVASVASQEPYSTLQAVAGTSVTSSLAHLKSQLAELRSRQDVYLQAPTCSVAAW